MKKPKKNPMPLEQRIITGQLEEIVRGLPRHLVEDRDWGPLWINPHFSQYKQGTKEAFRSDFDFITHDEMRDLPQWMLNMHVEHPCVGKLKDGRYIWISGTVHDGIWTGDGCVWLNGCFRDGIWLDGDWYDGVWVHGEKRGGNFNHGIWRTGIHSGGYFGGCWEGGLWLGGYFDGYWGRRNEPPPMVQRK